jgi:hypothetical protein
VDFAGVQKILVDMKRKTSGSPHGDFWKKDYDAFLKYEFTLLTIEGKMKLLKPGDSAGSNLIRALRGAPLLVTKADGSVHEETFSVMPPKGGPMKPDDIEKIRAGSTTVRRRRARTAPAAGRPRPLRRPRGPRGPHAHGARAHGSHADGSCPTAPAVPAATVVSGDAVGGRRGRRLVSACSPPRRTATPCRVFTSRATRPRGTASSPTSSRRRRFARRDHREGSSPRSAPP